MKRDSIFNSMLFGRRLWTLILTVMLVPVTSFRMASRSFLPTFLIAARTTLAASYP